MKAARFLSAGDRHRTDLERRQNLKMARSAHFYVRGSTARFYKWLASDKGARLPQGPPVWICGDCHVGNLGPVSDAGGRVDIEIRDLDQTVIGNPAHDLVRLAFSLASAARGSNLPGAATAQLVEEMVRGYQSAFGIDIGIVPAEASMPPVITKVMKQALRRKWAEVAKENIGGPSPQIPLGKRFLALSRQERAEIDHFFARQDVRSLVAALHFKEADEKVELLDAAFWVKGCSSLGRLRYAVLMRVGGKKGMLSLFDLKEASRPLAPRCLDAAIPRSNADRVVSGALRLSPALGERMWSGSILHREVFVRELLPQDLKFDVESLSAKEAVEVSRYLAAVVGRAHARQMDQTARAAWRKELTRQHSKTLDAPSWLWRAVVDLMVEHEAAYLQHCRRFATIARKSG